MEKTRLAGFLILNDVQALLLLRRRSSQHWELPGGAVHPGESNVDGARRELAEETGLLVADGQLVHVTEFEEIGDSGLRREYRYHVYIPRAPVTGELVIGDPARHDAVGYWPWDGVLLPSPVVRDLFYRYRAPLPHWRPPDSRPGDSGNRR